MENIKTADTKKIKQNKSHVKRYIIQNLQLQEELHIYHVIMEL